MKLSQLAIAAFLFAALLPTGWSQSKALELGHETRPSSIRMPESDTSELVMQNCATCQVLRLRASTATRYVLDGRNISRSDMTKFLARDLPTTLVVMQFNGTNELSRIVAHSR